ncbi:MAG TPA: hypothetical protein VNK48_15395 [Xanthobacteraceae bacterium]|nr:hypothetical protein [Xanthobacteraceae bacterium]
MSKLFVQCAAATCIAAMAAAMPTGAEAGSRRGAVAAGVIGGLAAGAIIGSAIANSNGYGTYDGYGTYYAPPVAYYGPGSPGCYWHWQRVWDGYMWRNQRVYMCY